MGCWQNCLDTKESTMLPKTISNKYKLYKHKGLSGQSSSKKGLYINKKTKAKVFIKVNNNIQLLFREYDYQQLFYKRLKELKASDIVIPKPLEILKIDNYAALVMEYISAESILNVDVKTRLDTYIKLLDFLEKINSTNNTHKKHNLIQKSASEQLVTLPYFLFKNLLLYPSHAPLFIRSVSLIIRFIPQWMKLASNWICHGDINVTNILTFRKKVVLLDFTCTYLSHCYFDISRALNSTWYQADFHEKLWDYIICEFKFTARQQDLLKSFVIFNLMQRLSQRYTDPNQKQFYIKRLERMVSSI